MPNSSAKARARSALRDPTATTSDAVPTATASANVCAMPPGATVSAGYLRIRNAGPTADRLLSASSPAAKSVELHETTMTDGDMQMRELERL